MKRFFLIPVLWLLQTACGERNTAQGESESFLKNYKEQQLPVTFKPCKISVSGLPHFANEASMPDADGFIPYMRFKQNGNFLAVVSVGMANCPTPLLITYDVNGNKIDEAILSLGGCNSGPGFDCEETVMIGTDWSVLTTDTIRETHLDERGVPIKDSSQLYVLYREGRIGSNGSIQLSDTKKQILWNERNE